jgi:hypothetical protein
MKRRIVAASILTILIIVSGYFIMSEIGALRLALLLNGHPVSALTLAVKEQPSEMELSDNQTGFSLENPPVDKETSSKLVNWVVTRHGFFYTAEYYGWA